MARNQLKVLDALDVARTQWYHFTAIVIAGMGFFTDAYDFFSISLITELLGRIYYDDGKLPLGCSAAILGTTFFGAVLGQLVFGVLGDRMGRKLIYGVTLKLMVVCSLASGFSFGTTHKSVIATLCFFRFWLGFSIGGDYPLSATIMSEYANKRTRGAFIAAVFSMQGLGNIAAGIVGVIVSVTFWKKDGQADYVWRIILMLGAVPALLTYYLRMQMPETARYTALVAKNANKAALDMSAVLSVDIEPAHAQTQGHHEFGLLSVGFLRRHGLHLLSTTACWLVLDVTFYSLNLFMKDIFTDFGWFGSCEMEPLEQALKIAGTQALIAVVGTLPGHFFTVALVDRIGRVKIQLLGFTMMTVFMLGLAVPYTQYWVKHKVGSAAMYAIIFFFANFGPNSTTFIIPAEIFPARLRSTCHGVSGAGGKVGAIVGVFVSLYVAFRHSSETESTTTKYVITGGSEISKQAVGETACNPKPAMLVRKLLFILIGCNLVGLVFTLLLPEARGKSLEEITGEIEDEELPEDAAVGTAGADDVHTIHL